MKQTQVVEVRGERETRQPERVIMGRCPECRRVVIVENHREVWPLVHCVCGWRGATDAIDDYVRYESECPLGQRGSP